MATGENWKPIVRRFPSEEEWIAARRGTPDDPVMTATDSRGVLSEGYSSECPTGVYEGKLSTVQEELDEETEKKFAVGHFLEPVCVKLFEMLEGIKCKTDRAKVLRCHKDWPWMAATLDAYYYDRKQLIPVEFKGVGAYNASEWSEEVPIKVQIQVQHQMACCNSPYAWVLVFIDVNNVKTFRVERDDEFIEALIRILLAFRNRVIERRPPPPDFSAACEKALTRLHPDDDGSIVMLPQEVIPIAEQLKKLDKAEKEAKAGKSLRKNLFRAMMGNAAYGELPSGGGFSWKTQESKPKVVECPQCHERIQVSNGSKSRVFRNCSKFPKGVPRVEYAGGVQSELLEGPPTELIDVEEASPADEAWYRSAVDDLDPSNIEVQEESGSEELPF